MKSKIIGFILFVILVICVSGTLIYKLLLEDNQKVVNVAKVENTIEEYNYSLDNRDTKLMQEEFDNLKKNLTSDNIDYEEYAKSLAKLYVIDLYTIDNKINVYDIPCLEYILEDNKENFSVKIESTLYLYLKDNSDNKRTQELPVVKSITANDLKLSTYTIDKKEYDAYEINISWDYEKDLDYEKAAKITIIKKDKKLYVVKQETTDKETTTAE